MANILVIGAGVVGLSTAVRIQDFLPGSKVTIMADAFFEQTTSYGPPGIFRPLATKTPGVPMDTLIGWLRTSWEHYSKLARSPEGGVAACTFISGYHLHDGTLPPTLAKHFTTDFRDLSEQELAQFPVKYSHGWFYTTLICEPRKYLPYLYKRFKARGGRLRKRHVNSLEEVAGSCDVLVNCAGLGNQELTNDKNMTPIRGTLLRVKAPWVKHFLYTDTDCYIIPGCDDVILGGIPQRGRSDLQPLQEDRDDIWRKATAILPSLKKADLSSMTEWVGLRPHRNPLRLETEVLQIGTRGLPVVHNYGHGASGVTLGWGTATEAAHRVTAAVAQLKMAKL